MKSFIIILVSLAVLNCIQADPIQFKGFFNYNYLKFF